MECYALLRGKSPKEAHHLGGAANSPLTVNVPANDHRRLSDAQYDWPPTTLSNPDGSPLIALAGSLRGVADFIAELIVAYVNNLADFIEKIDAWLRTTYGRWWVGSPFDGLQPG